jgi:hypothetical protein
MAELRTLVLYEHEEGCFTQVMFDAERYKALTELMSFPSNYIPPGDEPPPGIEMRYIPQREDWSIDVKFFEGLLSVYPSVPRAPPILD